MDLYKKYIDNPMSMPRVLVLTIKSSEEYTKSRTIILNRYGNTNIVNMSGVKPKEYPTTIVAIPHTDNKVYVYFKYDMNVNPLIPITYKRTKED